MSLRTCGSAMASLQTRRRDDGLGRRSVLWICALLCLSRTVSGGTSQQQADWRGPDREGSSVEAGLSKPVSLGAGLSDVTATVGRVFKFAVPEDAFRGDNLKYQITEAGRESVPSWLFYSEATSTLSGIPSEADLDQYYLQVTAVGRAFNSSAPARVTDIFSLAVLPDDRAARVPSPAVPLKDAAGGQTGRAAGGCGEDEAAVEATIMLDANWNKLAAADRLAVVAKMSSHSRLAPAAFRLLPAGSRALAEGSLMVAGPGNIRRERHPGVALSWRIGCSDTSDVDKFPVVTVLETAARDGSMAAELRHDVIGWRVTNDRPDRLRRVRRQAKLMGTPVPTPVPTAATPKPTAVRDTTLAVPSTMMTVSRSFTVVEPTPSVKPTAVRPTASIRPTASLSRTASVAPTPSSSRKQEPTVAPTSTAVVKTRTPVLEPTPTPSVSKTLMPTPSVSKPPTPQPSTATPVLPTPTTQPQPTTPEPSTAKETPAVTEAPNKQPEINKALYRVDAQEGKLLRFTIPEDTFYDAEDGYTRSLDLVVLTFELAELSPKFWLKFDKKTQTLTGLPLAEQAKKKRYNLILVAQDSEGQEVENAFEVVVAAAPKISEETPPPVKMGMTLDIDYDRFINDPVMQLFILNKIASAFGDSNADAITITEIRRGSVVISWVNNTLPTDSCNQELILELQSKIMTPDGKPTQALIDAFLPEFNITEVESLPLGACASTTPAPPPTTSEDPAVGGREPPGDMWISTVLPAVVVALILLIGGVVIFILYRKNRKGKLSDEDQNTFINKGIPIIFADEIEDGEKQPSSSSPLILKTEKPPLSPPEYTETQQPLLNRDRPQQQQQQQPPAGDDEDKHSLPMVDMSGTPSYQPPPPLSPSPPENRNNTPARDISSYRKPPAYVHIQP